jgi:hypothetical protein
MSEIEDLKAQLAEMRKTTQYLQDRQQILDCVIRYCRGLDRHDRELLESAFHDDAIDNHGARVDAKPAFYDLRTGGHNDMSLSHLHSITNHSCEIDGNTAHTESYVLFISRHKDGKTIWFGGGRYVDRLEKRDGVWGIVVRRLVIEFRFPADGTVFTNGKQPALTGKWDRTDVSFDRPLNIPQDFIDKINAPA